MEDRLKYIFGLINDWIKFAEAKNAAIIVAAGAIFNSTASHLPDRDAEFLSWLCCLIGCSLLVLAAFVSLGSFLPKLTYRWGASRRLPLATDNLYYFGNISHLSAADYLNALYSAEAIAPPNRKLELDLAGQIVTNAAIVQAKFLHFRVAAWCTLIAIILLGSSAISHFHT